MYSILVMPFHGLLAISFMAMSYFSSFLFKRKPRFSLDDKLFHDVEVKDQVIIVTGANTGVGRQTALHLAALGATVILACRDIEKGMNACKEINETIRTWSASSKSKRGLIVKEKGKAIFMRLDLSDLQSVHDFSSRVRADFNRVDVLVNNAGLNGDLRLPSGLHQLFQVNYLGHYLLVRCLEDLLSSTATTARSSTDANSSDNGEAFQEYSNSSTEIVPTVGRVVNLSSVMHHFGQPDFERSSQGTFDFWMEHKYSYYADSKFYMNLLTMEINRRWGLRCMASTQSNASTPTSEPNTTAVAITAAAGAAAAIAGGGSCVYFGGARRPIVAISANPGAVRSDIWRNFSCMALYDKLMRMLYLEVREGSATSVYAAVVDSSLLIDYFHEHSECVPVSTAEDRAKIRANEKVLESEREKETSRHEGGGEGGARGRREVDIELEVGKDEEESASSAGEAEQLLRNTRKHSKTAPKNANSSECKEASRFMRMSGQLSFHPDVPYFIPYWMPSWCPLLAFELLGQYAGPHLSRVSMPAQCIPAATTTQTIYAAATASAAVAANGSSGSSGKSEESGAGRSIRTSSRFEIDSGSGAQSMELLAERLWEYSRSVSERLLTTSGVSADKLLYLSH